MNKRFIYFSSLPEVLLFHYVKDRGNANSADSFLNHAAKVKSDYPTAKTKKNDSSVGFYKHPRNTDKQRKKKNKKKSD